MRQESTAAINSLRISKSGLLFVSGFATSLCVDRGHLVVRSGAGRRLTEARIPKVGRPRLRRLVVLGRGGYATFEALTWIDRVGATFLHLDRSGRVVAMSGQPGPDVPALRRAQVTALDTDVGLSIVKLLLGAKLGGQGRVMEQYASAHRDFAQAQASLSSCTTSRGALAIEAKAASAYWSALASIPVRFAKADAGRIPDQWSTLGERHSILSSKPRLAISPGHSILNFLYHLATAEASLALLALGLDPGLGWAHRDAPYRDGAALDLVEAVRPDIDDYVLDLLGERTFSRREFIELPSGQVRLAPSLARLLAVSTMGRLEAAVATHAEEVARVLAHAAGAGVRAPKASRRGGGGKGRGALARGSTTEAARTKRVPNACRMCGVILSIDERGHVRRICNDCLPGFKAERTAKLVGAAKQTLATMRSSEEDPAQTPEAKAKRSAAVSGRARMAREWKRKNPGPYDREEFVREVLPGLARVTLPTMVKATGLTSRYCLQIRRGERTPHPMYWAVLRALQHEQFGTEKQVGHCCIGRHVGHRGDSRS